jgi:hypothetical protein
VKSASGAALPCDHGRVTHAASIASRDDPTRTLVSAPPSFFVPGSGEPAVGSYAGPLPAVSLAPGLRARITRQKRWFYAAIVTDEVWISLAVVRTGYAATAFAFVYDRQGKRMMVDRTVLGPATVAQVIDDVHAPGEIARFAMGKTALKTTRRGRTLEIHLRMADLEIDAAVDESSGPPAISAIAQLGEGLVSGTEKRALLSVRGRARIGNREVVLDGGTAGYDYTHGLLPRHTQWRWAFAMGEAEGQPFGFNVVQGFVGEAECAAFFGGEVLPIAEPRFSFDIDAPMRAWRLVAAGIDLAFEPGAVHAQNTNLLVVKSRFIQPVGHFTGTIRVKGRDLKLTSLPGVVEDQDVLW